MVTKYKHPIARLKDFLKLESDDITTIFYLIIGAGVLSLATPVAIQALVNIVTMGGVLEPLFVVSLILFILLVLSGSLYIVQTYLVEHIQRRFFVRTAIESAEKTQTSSNEADAQYNTAELMNRFLDVTTVQKSLAKLLTSGFTSVLQAFIGSVVLMFYSFYFAIIVLLIIACLWFIVRVIGRLAIETAVEESFSKYQVVAWLESIAHNINAFKFLQGKHLSMQKIDQLSSRYLTARENHFTILLKQNVAGVLLYATAGTAMLALGGALVIQGQINLGQFVAAELIIFNVLASFLRFIYQLEYFYDLLSAFDKIGMIQDLPQELVGGFVPKSKQIDLRFNDVSLGFNRQPNVLNHINFEIAAGEHLAVVAESGQGKTLLAELMVGLKQPNSGYIQYQGVDIRQLDIETTRQLIGYVRKLELIEDTIAENIKFGRPNIDVGMVTEVLNALGLLEVVLKLDKNIDTKLSVLGLPLSTIQAKLIVIARTIISEPAILVLDGILDDFDQPTLVRLFSVLLSPERKWTLIVLTKHQYIADYCDNIVHLNNGQLN